MKNTDKTLDEMPPRSSMGQEHLLIHWFIYTQPNKFPIWHFFYITREIFNQNCFNYLKCNACTIFLRTFWVVIHCPYSPLYSEITRNLLNQVLGKKKTLCCQYAVKVRRHNPLSRGPLSWIPGMWFTLCQFSFAMAQSLHNSEIYNIGVHAQ